MTFVRLPWFVPVLALALLVRLPQMAYPLWNDEAFVWVVSGRPLSDWWAALAGDVHPPLWYAIERVVAAVSRAPWVLRLFPLACGLAVVYLVVQVARALDASPAAQVGAALIAAFAPMQIYYSAEVRMYSLLAVLYLAGTWCVLHRRWGWLAVCLTALLYTHHYGWVYAATLGALALWIGRDQWRRVVACGGVALLLYLPLLPATLKQIAGTGAYWANLGPESLPMVLSGWLAGYSFDRPLLSAALIVGALALVMAATWRAVARQHYLLLWLTFGPLLIGLGLALFKNVWMTRAFIGSAAMAAVLLAVELTVAVRARWAAAAMVGALLVAGVVMDQQRLAVAGRYATPEVAAYLRSHLQPGDSLLCLGSPAWMELQPYQLLVPMTLAESGDALVSGGLSEQTRRALGASNTAPDTPGRVWVFSAHLPGPDPEVPAGSRLVRDWKSRELAFHSALYLLEDTYGNTR